MNIQEDIDDIIEENGSFDSSEGAPDELINQYTSKLPKLLTVFWKKMALEHGRTVCSIYAIQITSRVSLVRFFMLTSIFRIRIATYMDTLHLGSSLSGVSDIGLPKLI